MENPEIAQIFEEIADMLELRGENRFRARAYRRAAVTLRDLAKPLKTIVATNPSSLVDLPGIGEDLAGKIVTIVRNGDLPLRQELCRVVPPGLRELMRLPGCGPKRVMALHKELNVHSIADLRQMAMEHRIRGLKGFGAKTERNILQALEQLESTSRRMYFAEAQPYADALLHHLNTCNAVKNVVIAGSYRRRKETVGDLDILVTCKHTPEVRDRFEKFEGVVDVLASGKTKCSVRLRNGLQVDMRAVSESTFGAAYVYFTGSKQHNIQIRQLARQRGLKISEYGVYRGTRRIAGRTEEQVYRSIGLSWIPPELREARGEIELAARGNLPSLVNAEDIRGDLHMHTTATDGRSSIKEMICAAKEHGYQYIAITDHSKRVTVARGLKAGQLRRHWQAIERAASAVSGITVLRGVEVDILENGTLDLPDSLLAEADWVVASIHFGHNQSEKQITRRVLNAIGNVHVDAIGHPTGRLIGRRRPYAINVNDMFTAAADSGCMLELNCQPSRLDLDDVALAAAKSRGIRIVLATDAHSADELRFMEFGINQARRAGLEASDIANSRSLAQFRRLLRK